LTAGSLADIARSISSVELFFCRDNDGTSRGSSARSDLTRRLWNIVAPSSNFLDTFAVDPLRLQRIRI